MAKGTIYWGPRHGLMKVQSSHSYAAASACGRPVLVLDTCGALGTTETPPGWTVLSGTVIPFKEIRRIYSGFGAVAVNHVRDGQSLRCMADFSSFGLPVFGSLEAADQAEACRALAAFAGERRDWNLVEIRG